MEVVKVIGEVTSSETLSKVIKNLIMSKDDEIVISFRKSNLNIKNVKEDFVAECIFNYFKTVKVEDENQNVYEDNNIPNNLREDILIIDPDVLSKILKNISSNIFIVYDKTGEIYTIKLYEIDIIEEGKVDKRDDIEISIGVGLADMENEFIKRDEIFDINSIREKAIMEVSLNDIILKKIDNQIKSIKSEIIDIVIDSNKNDIYIAVGDENTIRMKYRIGKVNNEENKNILLNENGVDYIKDNGNGIYTINYLKKSIAEVFNIASKRDILSATLYLLNTGTLFMKLNGSGFELRYGFIPIQ